MRRCEPEHERLNLAILSVAAHARTLDDIPMAAAALDAADALDNSRGEFYSDVVLAFLSDLAPQLLEQFMDLRNYKFKSEFARKYVAIGKREGRAEGRAEGMQLMLRKQLERRFGALGAAHEERIDNATQAELERWLEAILDAASLDAVFVEAH